jgi:histone H3/H4
MSKFEYTTFVMGRCSTPAAKYTKVNEDLEDANAVPFWRKNRAHIKMLNEVKSGLELEYSTTDLQFSNSIEQIEYFVERLAKRSAIELLSTGKVSSETMEDMTCLGSDYFSDCVRKATVIASQLNNEVQAAEKTVQQDDVVPKNMM